MELCGLDQGDRRLHGSPPVLCTMRPACFTPALPSPGQAITAAGSGCQAALAAERYLSANGLAQEFSQAVTEEVRAAMLRRALPLLLKMRCHRLMEC